jgi:RNA polymerase sigma factor (sigma-70 family)
MPRRALAPVLHYLRRIEADSHEPRDTDSELLARFVRRDDEDAFATLLRRHGPMVHGVCRRVLRDRCEAEDAFQATFLILVRKAASLRQPELLGNWLYGVAYRTALKARSRAARNAGTLADDIPAPACEDVTWRDLRPLLDSAIGELPAKYRVPFVLCHLQGLTNVQAARQLGCPEGTVATRLARARQKLRCRLAKHGLGVASLGIAATALPAAPPALLVVSTLRIATACRLGISTAVPATVAKLTEGAGQTMVITKLRFVLALLALIGTGGGTAFWALNAQEPLAAKVVQPPPTVTDLPVAPSVLAPAASPIIAGDQRPPAVMRTTNFIVHAPSPRIAELVGDAAERLRKSEAIRWLGKELPAWPELCTLKVTLGTSGHATTFEFGTAKVLRRDMTLDGSLDRVLCIGLPHEITHTILADHFRAPVPRWADEGAALLAEDVEEHQRHRTLLRDVISQPNRWIPLTRLLSMREYPQDVMALYAEGFSLTQFLLERKDRKTFLAFVAQGMNGDDWETAAHVHYGFDGVEQLEQAWRAHVAKDRERHPPQTDTASQRTAVIKSCPPNVGRALIDADGRLVLRCPVSYYEPVTGYDTGENVAVLVTRYALRVTERVWHQSLDDMIATDVAGKPIDAKTLAKRLRTETTVLIGPAGQTVDPYYLAVVRENTIILTPRRPEPPPAPMLPPAVAPK